MSADAELHHLPSVPPTLRHLTTVQSEALREAIGRPRHRSFCPTCSDDGTFRWYAEGSRDEEDVVTYQCPCSDQFLLHRRFLWSGIMERDQRAAWEDFEAITEEVAEGLARYLDSKDTFVRSGVGMVFWGPTGTGKSLAAALLAKQIVVEGHDVYMQTQEGVVDAFADGWKDRVDRRWFNQRVRNAEVLFIDGVGRERNRSAESVSVSILEQVLQHRSSRDLPTFLVSHETPDALARGYGRVTASLLEERSITVRFTGENWRGKVLERKEREGDLGLTRPLVVG